MGFTVYILRSRRDGSLYVGYTRDLAQRLARHNNPYEGSYTSKRGPWVVAHSEEHPDRSAAMARERFLKSCAGACEERGTPSAEPLTF